MGTGICDNHSLIDDGATQVDDFEGTSTADLRKQLEFAMSCSGAAHTRKAFGYEPNNREI